MRRKPLPFNVIKLLIASALTLSLITGAWAKPKFKVLAALPGLYGGLTLDSKGNLYGAATGGGDYGDGTVFEVSRNSKGKWTVTVLHSFDGKDGTAPNGGLVFDTSGNLYGTAPDGGPNLGGTVFELSPGSGGWSFAVIDGFCSGYKCPEGGAPGAGLVLDKDGNLLGTAQGGIYNMGVVFELTPGSSGWEENVLYSFGSRSHDGSDPMDALVLDGAGDLYGTTAMGGRFGGGGQGAGTVFKLTPISGGGWNEKLLWQFDGTAGQGPENAVTLDSAGRVYGTTDGGGGDL
jgi:hypothetical protein